MMVRSNAGSYSSRSILTQQTFQNLALICLALVWPSFVWGGPTALHPDDVSVRIAVLKDAEEAAIRIRGEYILMDPLTSRELDRGFRLGRRLYLPTPTGSASERGSSPSRGSALSRNSIFPCSVTGKSGNTGGPWM
ncbi:MAG: hypothetical protein WC450_12695 [Candidatus Omnitrophota bacterium]|jgi:hypothetical protein